MAEQILTVEQTVERQNFSVKEWVAVSTLTKDLQEPYASVIGSFKDDPMLDAMMENIRERRREIDNDDTIE